MSQILTFLGTSGTARAKIAIATAKTLSSQGKRVLLATRSEPVLPIMLNVPISAEPQEIAANLQVVGLQASPLLERNWEEVKKLEAQYLKTPVLKEVYGQELTVLPGMDNALALNAIREYFESGKYDVIVYDGPGDTTTIRTFGMPESISWYVRRFRQLFTNSDFGKALSESPFVQPLISNFFNVNWTADNFSLPTNQANTFLEKGKAALADPKQVAAFLVTTSDPVDILTTRYLWGSAQLVGLIVGGAIAISDDGSFNPVEDFAPLGISPVPDLSEGNWQPLMDALPDFEAQAIAAPKPIEIDTSARLVRLFIPGFDKKQVKLTQNGPEVTIEAGDQRRNLFLPPALKGKPVTGAKFQNHYLIISF